MRVVWGVLGWSVPQEVRRKIKDEIYRLPDCCTRGNVCFEIIGSHFAYCPRPRLFIGDVIKCGA